MLTIVSLDPGVTTGVCIYRDIQGYHADRTKRWEQWQLAQQGFERCHKALWAFLTKLDPTAIVYEAFTYQRRDNVNLTPVEYIGVIELYIQLTGKPSASYHASQVKKLWTDEKLKALGIYMPGRPHAMDATRHMLHYLVVKLKRNDLIAPLRGSTSGLEVVDGSDGN